MITTQQIENTNAFKKLEKFKQKMLLAKNNRIQIERALIHYRATKEIMTNIGASNVLILKEIINLSYNT